MDRRLKRSFAVAAAVAAAAAAGIAFAPGVPTAPRPELPLSRAPVAVVEHCRRAAELLYDVHWAAACFKGDDDSNDCMLPDGIAAKVNAILDTEEARCMAVEAQALARP